MFATNDEMSVGEEGKKKKITLVLEKQPDDYNHDNVRFDVDGEVKGFGYIGRKSGKIGLQTCPLCERENYAMNISSGQCTWCPFNANETK